MDTCYDHYDLWKLTDVYILGRFESQCLNKCNNTCSMFLVSIQTQQPMLGQDINKQMSSQKALVSSGWPAETFVGMKRDVALRSEEEDKPSENGKDGNCSASCCLEDHDALTCNQNASWLSLQQHWSHVMRQSWTKHGHRLPPNEPTRTETRPLSSKLILSSSHVVPAVAVTCHVYRCVFTWLRHHKYQMTSH